MDAQAIRDKFRHQFTDLHALTVFTVSLFEIIGYIILIMSEVEYFSLRNLYLWYGVILPIVVNTITHLVARRIVKSPNHPQQKKNEAVIIAALVTSFVVAVLHKEYIVTSCAFIFPIILSSMFNDRKLLNISFAGSILIFLAVGAAFWLDRKITLVTSINLFILFGFLFISYLCGIISINFSKHSYSTIETQAAQNDKLQQDVLRDHMTKLYNHAAFDAHLAQHIAVWRPEAPLCLAMIDVDDFKFINDTYGHDCGDDVLIRLAQTIQNHCAQNGAAYRYGGEEFAVIFSGTDAAKAQAITEGILEAFRATVFPFTDKTITFSAGIAPYNRGITAEDLFEQADKTLYAAKRAGKNRVLIQ